MEAKNKSPSCNIVFLVVALILFCRPLMSNIFYCNKCALMAPPDGVEDLTSCMVTLVLLAASGRLLNLIGCVSMPAIKLLSSFKSNLRDLNVK